MTKTTHQPDMGLAGEINFCHFDMGFAGGPMPGALLACAGLLSWMDGLLSLDDDGGLPICGGGRCGMVACLVWSRSRVLVHWLHSGIKCNSVYL